MDKYEYKHLVEQIQSLIDQGQYAEAAAIADKIDWRRVRSVMTLGTISDLYKINCRYEDARDIMLLAYDRKPENRQICYSLCELYIKTGEPVEAAEFYKEFEKLAPKDPGRYVLKYKLYDAYDVSLDEKIEVLEKLKEEEYREKWMYELANLYHRRGLGTKCVEVCDELILWFGTGKYVNMAMELKMLHEPLTPSQQLKYDNRFQEMARQEEGHIASNETYPAAEGNVQAQSQEVASGATAIWNASDVERESAKDFGATRVFNVDEVRQQLGHTAGGDDMDIQVKTVDVGQYNTMNLQAEIAAGLKEVLEKDPQDQPKQADGMLDPITRVIVSPMIDSDSGPLDLPVMEGVDEEEELEAKEEAKEPEQGPLSMEKTEVFFEIPGEAGEMYQDENGYFHDASELAARKEESAAQDSVKALEKEAMKAQPPERMAKVLTQEADGQLSLVVPENKKVEKQITGQLSIEDIRAEWERMKQESQAKQEEEVHQQVLRQTGRMFTEFEEAMRDNILKQMEDTMDPASIPMPAGVTVPEVADETADDVKVEGDAAAEETVEKAVASVEGTAEEVAEAVAETAEEVAEAVAETAEEVAEAVAENAEETVEAAEATKEIAEEVAETVAESAEETMEAAQAAAETAEEVAEAVEETTEAVAESTEETVESVATAVEETTEETAEAVAESAEEAEKAAEEVAESLETKEPERRRIFGSSDPAFFARPLSPESEKETEFGYEWDAEEPFAEELAAEEPVAEDSETEPTGEPVQEAPVKAQSPFEIARNEVAPASDDSLEDDFSWSEEAVEDEGEQVKVHGWFSGTIKEPTNGAINFENLPREEDAQEGAEQPKQELPKARELTKEEEDLYDELLQADSDREQLVRAIDNISMAAYTGNLIITGDSSANALELAKKIIYEVKQSDSNFSGKVAKIPGKALNNKDLGKLLDDLTNGALIVEKASDLTSSAAGDLYGNLQRENFGIIVVLLDTKKSMNKFLKSQEGLRSAFNARIDLQPMTNDALAYFARQYARDQEYSIDDLGMLALHTKIDEMQTANHAVTTAEVKEIMDDAIYSASRKTLGHFFDILLGRRYDEEDMIIITEKDFI